MKKHKLLLILIFVLYFVLKMKFLSLPLHNDEISHLEGVLKIKDNNFSPIVEWWGYHPPVVFLTAALLSLINLNLIVLLRILSSLFGLGSLIMIYLLGKKIFNQKVGIISLLLLFFFPLFQSQSSLFHLSVPLMFFFLAAFYFFISKKWLWYLVFASLLVLTKEIGFIIVILLGLLNFFIYFKKNVKQAFKETFYILLPGTFFIIWLLLNKQILGWYLWPVFTNVLKNDFPFPQPDFISVIKANFLSTGNWLISIGFVFSVFYLLKTAGSFLYKKTLIFGFIIFLVFPVFFYFSLYLPRYTLFTYPLVFVIISVAIDILFNNFKLKTLAVLVFVFLFLIHWFHFSNKKISWAGEKNFGYSNIINNHLKTVVCVNNNFPSGLIMTHFPLNVAFSSSATGYTGGERQITELNMNTIGNFSGLIIISDFFLTNQQWLDMPSEIGMQKITEITNPGIKTTIYIRK
jgi:hypothetical protein